MKQYTATPCVRIEFQGGIETRREFLQWQVDNDVFPSRGQAMPHLIGETFSPEDAVKVQAWLESLGMTEEP